MFPATGPRNRRRIDWRFLLHRSTRPLHCEVGVHLETMLVAQDHGPDQGAKISFVEEAEAPGRGPPAMTKIRPPLTAAPRPCRAVGMGRGWSMSRSLDRSLDRAEGAGRRLRRRRHRSVRPGPPPRCRCVRSAWARRPSSGLRADRRFPSPPGCAHSCRRCGRRSQTGDHRHEQGRNDRVALERPHASTRSPMRRRGPHGRVCSYLQGDSADDMNLAIDHGRGRRPARRRAGSGSARQRSWARSYS